MSWGSWAAGAATGATASAVASFALLQRYLTKELMRPSLIHAPMEERELEDQYLLQEVQLLLREYWPHPVLEFSGYISTMWSAMFAVLPKPNAPGRLEKLVLGDGGTVSLHWAEPPELSSAVTEDGFGTVHHPDRVALVLPGLNNESRTNFVQETLRHFREAGFQAVALNYRGVGELELTSPRVGCLDSWRDLPEVIDRILLERPGCELFGVGFSMGGGILLRHLGEAGEQTHFKAAVAIAAPVDMPEVAKALEASLKKRSVNFAMVSGVKLLLGRKILSSPVISDRIDKRTLMLARTMRQLDEAAICKLHGYRDADDYYSSNCPKGKLGNIAVPTLLVNAQDDPVISIRSLPTEELRRNHFIYAAVTRRGGHIGWGSGGLGAACWTDAMAVDFLKACTLRGSAPRPICRSRL